VSICSIGVSVAVEGDAGTRRGYEASWTGAHPCPYDAVGPESDEGAAQSGRS